MGALYLLVRGTNNKYQFSSTNEAPMINNQKGNKFDLEERTAKFAEQMIGLIFKLPSNSVNKSLIEQVIRSSGSIGANYCEANESESKADFIHKIGVCKKETKETKHWIRLMLIMILRKN